MIELRSFQKEDAKTILSWCGDETTFYKWTAGRLGNYPISEEQFLQVQSLMAFTAAEDGAPIGFFTMRRPGEDPNELRFGFVIVDPRMRGRGFGKAMLQQGLKYAAEHYGAKKVTLGVFENNPSACHCYRAAGFQDVPSAQREAYCVLGEEWNCLELEIRL